MKYRQSKYKTGLVTQCPTHSARPAGGTADNYILSQDRESDPSRPVFREAGYITGGTSDRLRIIKVQ